MDLRVVALRVSTPDVRHAMRRMSSTMRRRPWNSGRPSKPVGNALQVNESLPPPQRRSESLHKDILLFAEQFSEPRKQEQARREAIDRTRVVLQKIRPSADVHLFGSSATGMRLPLSDTDIMIEAPDIGHWPEARKEVIGSLAAALRKEKLDRTMLEKSDILKWTDRASGIKFDACVNNVRGLRSTALLGRAAVETPAIVPLVQVLKAQLVLHGVHQSYNGGVNGYVLANMVRHLMGRRRELAQSIRDQVEASGDRVLREHSGDHDLGGLLLLFYWYYGIHLDLSHTLLVSDGARRLHGDNAPRGALLPSGTPGWLEHKPDSLSLADPADPSNDLGRAAYRFGSVLRPLLRTSYVRMLLGSRQAAPTSGSTETRRARGGRKGGLAFQEEMPDDPDGVDQYGNSLSMDSTGSLGASSFSDMDVRCCGSEHAPPRQSQAVPTTPRCLRDEAYVMRLHPTAVRMR